MKSKKYTFTTWFVSLVLLTACNNKHNEDVMENKGIRFTISEVVYGDETEVSRATTSQTELGKDTINLGNGLEAEVSIEREPADNRSHIITRATEISNQHYTIYALKNGVRVATMSGTVSGSGAGKTFTPDTGTPERMLLAPGTYTFVCHNDKVIDTGSRLSISAADAGTALIGTTTKTISAASEQVHFEMKHQSARVRFELTTYWDIEGIKANVLPSSGDPVAMTYDLSASNPQYTGGSNTVAYTFPNSVAEQANYTYTSTSDYQHFLPTTKGNDFKLYFSTGSLYRKNIAGTLMTFSNKFPRTNLAANESYKVKIKLYYSFRYLFQDGTTATLLQGKAAGKTPIAAMITNNKAMALTDAGAYVWSNTTAVKHNTTSTDNSYAALGNDMNGYYYTWNGASTTSGAIKANEPVVFPAFYAAAHYVPLAAITAPAGKLSNWYLPAIGEWKQAAVAIGNYNASMVTDWGGYTNVHWDTKLARTVFVQAGGKVTIGSTQNTAGWYWSSTEWGASSAFHVIFYTQSSYGLYFAANPKTPPMMLSRPFIVLNY